MLWRMRVVPFGWRMLVAEWLFEILSEEIPSRMQPMAQEQLRGLAETEFQEQGLEFETIRTFVTPRRLTLVVEGLPLKTVERVEEKKGPRVDAPAQAIEGFLKTAGVSREACDILDTPKGQFLSVAIKQPGQLTESILSKTALSLLEKFRWPKSMRWRSSSITWVRPLRGLLCLFDGKVVSFSYAGIEASNSTQGHRFLAPTPFEVQNFKDYEKKLHDHFVILDWQERRQIIKAGVSKVAGELTPLKDESLLDEVTGLVEWPVALKGKVDKHFMNLPLEVITTPMRVHQRYFPLMNREGKLAPYFGVVANVEAPDQGKAIIIGNERVLRARLADAQFFWEQDQKHPLERFNLSLKTRLFHQHLGSVFTKVERLVTLCMRMAEKAGTDPRIMARAALLSKADLASQMVNEFPELQGIMGRYYAQNQKENAEVAQALEEQYWPKTSGGKTPDALPSLILAMADRLDTLVGFFAIGIAPTGSKDPFALRRAGLGLIALALNPSFSLSMLETLGWSYDCYPWDELAVPQLKDREETLADLWKFLLERFKFFLRDVQESPYDHVEAVLSVADQNPNLFDLSLRVKALDQLMDGEDGKNLLVAYKRASNILKIEEDKDKCTYEGQVNKELFDLDEESEFFKSLSQKLPEIEGFVKKGDFVKAVQDLATLRPVVDRFFDKVVVNTEDKNKRVNRLHLLAYFRKTLHQLADFSKIES
ncbi:MAG: glycine--tRNA ligase subunit beta [Alphaproteobacteria bacterium]|nr:glycine--tRNA ligase subunit beta [Alphaproteobacteria bacterium]